MVAGVLLALFGVGMFVALAVSAAKGAAERRNRRLLDIAQLIDGRVEGNAVTGTRHATRVTYRFETRGAGSSAESWTEVDAELPAAYPLAIHVYRQRRSHQALIDRNEM